MESMQCWRGAKSHASDKRTQSRVRSSFDGRPLATDCVGERLSTNRLAGGRARGS